SPTLHTTPPAYPVPYTTLFRSAVLYPDRKPVTRKRGLIVDFDTAGLKRSGRFGKAANHVEIGVEIRLDRAPVILEGTEIRAPSRSSHGISFHGQVLKVRLPLRELGV